MNPRLTRRIFMGILLVLFASCVSPSCVAESCSPVVRSAALDVGARCKEDPACVVIGGTHILEWKSPSPAKIVVVCIHGLGLCARAYKPLAQELSAEGIDGFGINVRGFGPDRDQPGKVKLDCIDTIDDVRKLLQSIRKEQPDYRIFLLGESMGGALTIRIASESPELVDGIICSAPAWKLLKMHRTAVKGIVELALFPHSSPGPAGRALLHQATSHADLTEHWLTDRSHKLKLTFGEATAFLNFIKKTDSFASRLTLPVLVVQGLNDRLVSPKAVAQLFFDIPSKAKTFLIDGTGEHLVLEEGQFTPAVVKGLVAWMKSESLTASNAPNYEVVDDEHLSHSEQRRLSKLLLAAGK